MVPQMQAPVVPELLFELNGHDITIGPRIVAQVHDLAIKALLAAPRQGTYVEKVHNVVTQEARLDFTILNPVYDSFGVVIDGTVVEHELEKRPNGGRSLARLDPIFRASRNAAQQQPGWIKHVTIVSDLHNGIDARVSGERIYTIDEYLREANGSPAITWVTMPEVKDDPEWDRIRPRLVAPLREDKRDSLLLGRSWEVRGENFPFLPWAVGFALKPLDGTEAVDVVAWVPGDPRSHTPKKIQNTLRGRGKMLCSLFHAPFPTGREADPLALLRMWVIPDLESFQTNHPRVISIGGANLSGKELIIHGTPDTRTGLLRIAA